MYAHRQLYEHAAATIDVPPELQHRSIEVIFMALDDQPVCVPEHGLGTLMANLFKNIPPVQSPEEELIIEPRSQQQDRPIDFE